MAERGLDEPLFYKGIFQHRSVRSGEMTREQRIEYRGIYRRLYRKAKGDYAAKMKARAMLRTMLYAEFGKNSPG